MRIVLNHLTRMKELRICVAGIDEQTKCHVRPVTSRTSPLTRALLTEHGGSFEIGALIDLGQVTPIPSAPEIEDHRCSIALTKPVGRLDADEYLQLLSSVSHGDLESIFGPDLQRRNWKFAIDREAGSASLGVLCAQRRPGLTVDRYGHLQLKLNDPEQPAYVPITDLRFFEEDHKTIRKNIVEDVRRRMRHGVDVVLMLGLARAFQAKDDDRERHWLQVNGICLADRPLGMFSPSASP